MAAGSPISFVMSVEQYTGHSCHFSDGVTQRTILTLKYPFMGLKQCLRLKSARHMALFFPHGLPFRLIAHLESFLPMFRRSVQLIQQSGFLLTAGVANTTDDIQFLLRQRVDGIWTDYPRTAAAVVSGSQAL